MAPRFILRSFYQQSAANDNPGHGSRLVLALPVRVGDPDRCVRRR
tara:strand:+ start:1280 stop:1414 length:135 start_codon:yes stop_codon:yes gene_type:complete